ncbi:hypothetical protein [Bradyrhizobium sp. CB2312]|nr:hypothetical protein [Bradyrhizobium sp. CB2312]WFU74812.1 hypothetical protein QA642_12500 [Bradyrhizobium sp. CB2312]
MVTIAIIPRFISLTVRGGDSFAVGIAQFGQVFMGLRRKRDRMDLRRMR